MTAALLALALLAHPHWRGVGPAEAHELATVATGAAERYGLPPTLLLAVVLVESRARRRLVVRRRCGWDAGIGQVHVHATDDTERRRARRRLQQLLTLSVGLDRSAAMLARSRERCAAHPRWAACKRSEWALYNSASRGWAAAVGRAHRRLLGGLHARPPTT